MFNKSKDKIIKIKIDELITVMSELLKLDQSNPSVIAQLNAIKNQITDYQLELIDSNCHIPLGKRIINNIKESRSIFINGIWVVFEALNLFTDVFKDVDNQYVQTFRLAVPSITIYLRALQK